MKDHDRRMNPRSWSPRRLVISAMFAAVYVALTLLLAPLSYGMMQVRVSEALTILPVLMPEAVPALFIGCLLANLLGPSAGILDIAVGSLCTLVAGAATFALRERHPLIALLPPIVCNALGVGLVISVMDGLPFILCALWVGAGQAIAVYGLGLPLLYMLRRVPIINKLLNL